MMTISKSRSMSASCAASVTSNHLYSKPLGRPGVCLWIYFTAECRTFQLFWVKTKQNKQKKRVLIYNAIFFRFPSLQHITSGLSLLISSCPGHSCLQPYDKNMFSAASWAGWATNRASTWLCGPQKPPQNLNSQPERSELHHHSLAASITLRQVIYTLSHTKSVIYLQYIERFWPQKIWLYNLCVICVWVGEISHVISLLWE